MLAASCATLCGSQNVPSPAQDDAEGKPGDIQIQSMLFFSALPTSHYCLARARSHTSIDLCYANHHRSPSSPLGRMFASIASPASPWSSVVMRIGRLQRLFVDTASWTPTRFCTTLPSPNRFATLVLLPLSISLTAARDQRYTSLLTKPECLHDMLL